MCGYGKKKVVFGLENPTRTYHALVRVCSLSFFSLFLNILISLLDFTIQLSIKNLIMKYSNLHCKRNSSTLIFKAKNIIIIFGSKFIKTCHSALHHKPGMVYLLTYYTLHSVHCTVK